MLGILRLEFYTKIKACACIIDKAGKTQTFAKKGWIFQTESLWTP